MFKFVTGQWNVIICKLTKRKWVSIETFFLLRRWKSYLGKQQPHWWKMCQTYMFLVPKRKFFLKKQKSSIGYWKLTLLLCCAVPSPIPLTSHTSLYFSVLEKAFVQLSTKVFTLDLNHDTQQTLWEAFLDRVGND